MPIITRKSHYNLHRGEWPRAALPGLWFNLNPFRDTRGLEGLSSSLRSDGQGILHGHNTAADSGYWAGCFFNHEVPLSPLFARDLAGRSIYLGYGPEVKDNDQWSTYRPTLNEDGSVPPEQFNPFIPLITFPRHCRDVAEMEGSELLEEVLFCHFRPLETAISNYIVPSGAGDEDEPIAPVYNGPNLYPYKLRLDTFYTDGYRLPQTQMLFARGPAQGINPAEAEKLGKRLLESWHSRETGTDYEAWFTEKNEGDFEEFFLKGCTLIPTFEAHNGYAVVGRDFNLQDYWPGRAVLGLHEVVEAKPDQAPAGTILQVIMPGYITARQVVKAQVVVSDGSGYVSGNASDPLPKVPNLNLPHSRTAANWRGCHLPTHPQHFEQPALWGWDPETGRFLQLTGPLWAPLYYFYACTDTLIDAYDFPPTEAWDEDAPDLIPVPTELKGRFWPIVPMQGFDTFNLDAFTLRREQGSKLRSMVVRQPTETATAGPAYHPLPMEFDFECEPFWSPELHPLNRQHGYIPEDLTDRIVAIISPKVDLTEYLDSIAGVGFFRGSWLKDPARMGKADPDALTTYPHLLRYLGSDIGPKEVMQVAATPILVDLGETLNKPALQWWVDDEGEELDTPEALDQLDSGLHDMLWDSREKGLELVRFRHMLYQTNLPLYILSYWFGSSPEIMQNLMDDWIRNTDPESAEAALQTQAASNAAAPEAEDLTDAEIAQLRAMEAMASARDLNRLTAEPAAGLPEEAASAGVLKTM